jgi:hypothetical protein
MVMRVQDQAGACSLARPPQYGQEFKQAAAQDGENTLLGLLKFICA